MMRRIVPIAAGVAWGLVVFWIALVLTFPSDSVQDRLAFELDRASGGTMALKLDGIRPSWRVTGARLEGLQLLGLEKSENKDDEQAASLLLSAARIDTRVHVLPLLGGSVFADLDAELYQGTLVGQLGQVEAGFLADLVASDLDLSLYPLVGDNWSVDASGLLDLVVDMAVDPDELKRAKGDIELDIEGLVLRSLTVSGFTVDEAVFHEAVLDLDVHDGEAEIQKGSFLSDMIEVTLGGKVTLSSPLERSRLKLSLKVRLDDDLDSLAKLAPGMKNARDDGGTYHFMVSGSLEKPRFREDRLAARKRKVGGAVGADREPIDRAGARPTSRNAVPEDDPEAEERRRLREERIAERRERMRESRDQQLDPTRPDDREGPDQERGGPPPDFDDDRNFQERRPSAADRQEDDEYVDEDLPEDEEDLEFDGSDVRDLGYAD